MTAQGRTPLTCPVCGAEAHPRDRVCPACGAALAAGDAQTSLFDDLMPLGAEPEEAYEPAHDPEPGPDEPRGRGVTAPLLVLAVVIIVALLAWRMVPGDGDGAGVAAPTASPSASQTAAGDDDGEPAPSESPSESPSATDAPRAIEKASGATRCGEARDGVLAWRGNDVTSCEFAVETAKAVVDASSDLPTTVTARSPVTKKDYAMECEDTTPVRCRGGNDALVYVDLEAR